MSYEIKVGHVEGIESPWANAGGVVKTTDDVLRLAGTGVGWIEDGSHVLGPKRLGNAWNPNNEQLDRVVYYHNPLTGETVNSLGMPGEGFDSTIADVPERIQISHAHKKKYVLNVAPVTDKPEDEVLEMVIRGYEAGVDAVLVNAGCPNVLTEDGGRHELLSRSESGLYTVLKRLYEAQLPAPIWLRSSPHENYYNSSRISEVVRKSSVVSAYFVPNTWPGYVPLDDEGNRILDVPGGAGGLSGPATAIKSIQQTAWAVDYFAGSGIDVVASSGIMNSETLETMLDIGAVAGAGTTFFYEPVRGIIEDTNKLLSELAS